MREYLLPDQEMCDERRPCLLCTRMLISMGYYNMLADSVPTGERSSGFALSPYYNLVDLPGEVSVAPAGRTQLLRARSPCLVP